jgi:hypothetical protein
MEFDIRACHFQGCWADVQPYDRTSWYLLGEADGDIPAPGPNIGNPY